MFSRSNLEEVTKNKVYLKLGTLNRWPTKVFKDLMNMAFTLFSGTSPTVTEVPTPNSDPVISKEHRQVQGLDLECSDSSHWAELPYASPASRVLHKLWTLLGHHWEVSPQVSPVRLGSGSQRTVLSCMTAEDPQPLFPKKPQRPLEPVQPSQDWVVWHINWCLGHLDYFLLLFILLTSLVSLTPALVSWVQQQLPG